MTFLRNVCMFRQIFRFVHASSSCNGSVRVRFAPSPTGDLHVGGLRTALYNYLFAKSQNGTFILRIEDTDQERLVTEAVKNLEDDLHWAKLDPDEGPSQGGPYGPYCQSQRLELYRKEVDRLLESENAYYCFCTERRLDLIRKDALRRREIPKYDNHCRHLTKDEVKEKLDSGTPYCIRFKLTPYLEPFHDLVYGPIVINVAEVEGDPVILKRDGFPTYHLANVVDDHHMKISHVLRGVEWQLSTTKHILLFKAFNWDPPHYAHIPLLLNEDRKKLSKRHGDLSVKAMRQQYIYPKALTNFLLLSGGGFFQKSNPDVTKELENIDELCNKFTLNAINTNSCQLPLNRLKDFNRIEIQRLVCEERHFNNILNSAKELILKTFPESKNNLSDERLKQVLSWAVDNGRISSIVDLIGVQFSFLWNQPVDSAVDPYEKKYFDSLFPLIEHYEGVSAFEREEIASFLKSFVNEKELSYSKFMRFLRACLSGLKDGPSVTEMFILLEKPETLQRLRRVHNLRKDKNINIMKEVAS